MVPSRKPVLPRFPSGTLIAIYVGRRFCKVMINTRLGNIIKGFALVTAMAFGLVIASSTNVSAQDYGYYNNGQNYRQNAYQRGYREGYQQGMQAARNGYSYNNNYGYINSYNHGYGYNNGYSNYGYENSGWRQAFQNGFDRGYRDGYNRYRRNNRSGFTIRLPF